MDIMNDSMMDPPALDSNEWMNVLKAADNERHSRQIVALKMFLSQKHHSATLEAIAKEFSLGPEQVKALITHFCKFALTASGKDINFQREDGKEVWWAVAMTARIEGDRLQLTLRPELVAALRLFLIQKVVHAYRGTILSEGLDSNRSMELYKWQLLSNAKGKPTEEILRLIGAPQINLISWQGKDDINKLLASDLESVVKAFETLRHTPGSFSDKIKAAKEFAIGVLPKEKVARVLSNRAASLFLACVDPANYTIFKTDVYKLICKYLGRIPDNLSPVEGFYDILREISAVENTDSELIAKIRVETESLVWSDLLNAQDILWQMRDYLNGELPKNWLQLLYEKALETWDGFAPNGWLSEYEKSIELFKTMFEPGKTASDIDSETIDYLLRNPENYISSNGQGTYQFKHNEYDNILKLWPQIYDILRRNREAGSIDSKDYDQLKKLIDAQTVKNRPAAYHRIWAAVFPDLLTTIITDWRFNQTFDKIRNLDPSLPQRTGRWLNDNIEFIEFLKRKVTFKNPLHCPIFAWYIFYHFNPQDIQPKMKKYIDLLKSNHNLILTGPPGTGKTYLAREIASAMGDRNPGFVQFHPSFDYTDFVEGLRPTEKGTFERMNGVFKQFCAEALPKSEVNSGNSNTPVQNRVFIIDEINRGELSKIFGELFYAIDPGYRGERGSIKTQYQNLVHPGDPFKQGFYVPENVYIIGTMNDIDRGVESMDFAVRRRFAWCEVSADERVEMLDEKIPDWAEKASSVMRSLNAALKDKQIGLTSIYDIGPAYFLKLENYDGDFNLLWDYHLGSILHEYLRGTRNIEEKLSFLRTVYQEAAKK